MNEMIEAAQARQKELDGLIAKREAEITEFRAEAEKLTTFIGLAEELFIEQDTEPKAAPTSPQNAVPNTPQHIKPQEATPQAAPQQAPQTDAQAPKSPEIQRVMPARQPRAV